MNRIDNRTPDALRPLSIECDFLRNADGSCLIACGGTRVLCTASVEEGAPPFCKAKEQGWVTAEYAMLPASTGRRKPREKLKPDGRSVEIQRLIGRALRQAVDLSLLGDRTIFIDCDVLDADGGTRCASITGFVALTLAIDKLIRVGKLSGSPIRKQVAAVSVGIVEDTPLLDLCYREDSAAQVDMNLVMEHTGGFIELQGTGEERSFSRTELDALLALGESGLRRLMRAQRDALGERARWIAPERLRLVVASANAHKLVELQALLGNRFDIVSMADAGFSEEIEETGSTFAENARIKAEAVSSRLGVAALADDSGLIVDALDGAPGVYSARYAGIHGDNQANNRLLLDQLRDVPAPRTARFACAIALARPGRATLVAEGFAEGEIAFDVRGTEGFGYDPLFLYNGVRFSEMSLEEKNRVSHRANALNAFRTLLDREEGLA
ncbi:MAG TPA: ribonuclease PH [Clostridia bacterium]|nr:ribonuclease PH [Clostridia bacterium]